MKYWYTGRGVKIIRNLVTLVSCLTFCKAMTAHYSLPTTHYSLLTAHYSLLTTHYSLLTTHCSLITTHYSLLTTHYSLLTAHCSLLTPHYSLLAVEQGFSLPKHKKRDSSLHIFVLNVLLSRISRYFFVCLRRTVLRSLPYSTYFLSLPYDL